MLDESGCELARQLWIEADVVASSQLVYPEARAAMAAAHRSGRIGRTALRKVADKIDGLYAAVGVVGLDRPMARAAGDLAERHALRGYDAVHLASALAIDEPGLLVVATWDREMAAAALAEGRMVVPAQ